MAIPAHRLEKERPRRIVYPDSDGKPMAETDNHADLMVYYKEALRARYAHDENVYISGNNFVFYEEGNPKARISRMFTSSSARASIGATPTKSGKKAGDCRMSCLSSPPKRRSAKTFI